MKQVFFTFTLFLGLLLLLNVSSAHALQILAESRFDIEPPCSSPGLPSHSSCINNLTGEGLDGWTFPTQHIYTFWASHGNDVAPPPVGGYLRFIDPDNWSGGYVDAPNKFLGDWSALDSVGRLDYDFKVFQTDTDVGPTNPYGVTINGFDQFGDPMNAQWTGSVPLGPTPWVTLNIPITMTAWGVSDSADWSSLLSNVTGLRIDLELFDNSAINDERTGLDNVVLWGPDTNYIPEPSPFLLLGSGLAGLGLMRRKFKGES